jgi:hypothetical protein
MVIFFFASAAASSAYLTVSETFPLEMRALAIAFFYAVGTGVGGIAGPWLFGILIDTGSRGGHLGRGATHDAFDDLQPDRGAHGDFAAQKFELAPSRPTCDVEVAAEAQRMDRRAERGFQFRDRGEVDDGHHLARHVGKAVAGCVQNLGRTA